MDNIENLLEGIGLTKGEVKVYFALLELGASTTGDIIKKAKVSRSKVYEMLDRLLDRGLVSFVVRENIKYFEAAPPKAIAKYIEKKKKELTEKETSLKSLLPALEKKHHATKTPQSAAVYQGIEGIRTIYNEILSTLKRGDEYYAIAIEPELHRGSGFDVFIENHHQKRAEKGINVKLLAHRSLEKQLRNTIGKTKYASIKATTQSIPAATVIYKDNVATFVWKPEPIGVVTRSKTIANRYKTFFEEVWNNAK